MTTVRDAAFRALRQLGGTTLFANPGSTEISLLTDLSEDFEFVLALHEGSVVGMATGYALAAGHPAVVILHTTAGLGNAVGALATARENGAPLVVVVGQQDRRHLASNPFLSGHGLDRLAGDYPVWTTQPTLARDVPGAIARAWWEADQGRGPALVIVPMDDWDVEMDDDPIRLVTPQLLRATEVPAAAVAELAKLLAEAESPVVVAGAGNNDRRGWEALRTLVERLDCPVWQEAFGAQAGFAQDHPQFAGHLPAGRAALRTALASHDFVLAVGAPVFRQYPYEPGALLNPGVGVAVVTRELAEAALSPVDLAIVAEPATVCLDIVDLLPERPARTPAEPTPAVVPPVDVRPTGRLDPEDVFTALAARLDPDTILVEESPSSRSRLQNLVPAREPLGFLSAAMGGLGFGLPAAIGARMARPDRPVVAVLGDGSSIYAIQALWSAAQYRVGVLIVVLANGRYAIMDQLARSYGNETGQPGRAPWPAFPQIDLAEVAEGFGCPARTVNTPGELAEVLDDIVPALRSGQAPMLLNVAVS